MTLAINDDVGQYKDGLITAQHRLRIIKKCLYEYEKQLIEYDNNTKTKDTN